MAYQSHHCSSTLLFSPVSVSLYLHLLALSDIFLFSTSAPQPYFTVSTMHLCSFLLLGFMLCILFSFSELHLFCVFHLLLTACHFPVCNYSLQSPHLFSFLPASSLCAPYAYPMHNASTCSSCRLLFLIIIATLQLLWLLNPCVHHH
jgi:hypothetical protein